MVNDFFYVGGQMNVENLAGNQFVNFALAATTELPSVFIGEFICNRLGRRWSHCLCMLIATIIFAVMAALSSGRNTSTVKSLHMTRNLSLLTLVFVLAKKGCS